MEGPGNFKVENGFRIPIVQDGSILWPQGVVSDPPKGLPIKGERWYEVNVRSIYRGVEGQWFHASEDFNDALESIIRKAEAEAEM